MEDPEVERVEESVVESRPVEAEEEKALLEEARKEAGVIDNAFDGVEVASEDEAEDSSFVEEPAVESRPVGLSRLSKKSRPFEAVPEKSSKKLMRLSKKSKKPSSKY